MPTVHWPGGRPQVCCVHRHRPRRRRSASLAALRAVSLYIGPSRSLRICFSAARPEPRRAAWGATAPLTQPGQRLPLSPLGPAGPATSWPPRRAMAHEPYDRGRRSLRRRARASAAHCAKAALSRRSAMTSPKWPCCSCQGVRVGNCWLGAAAPRRGTRAGDGYGSGTGSDRVLMFWSLATAAFGAAAGHRAGGCVMVPAESRQTNSSGSRVSIHTGCAVSSALSAL
jgi:hypothetical protein